jgi:hypothetical protein
MARGITTKQRLALDLNETKRNLTRKCLIYNRSRDFGAAIKYSLHMKQREGERIVFSTLASSPDCNHKFSPERAAGGEVVVHFCIVNRIAHSLTKQVYSTPTHSARRVFPIAIHFRGIIKCSFLLAKPQLETFACCRRSFTLKPSIIFKVSWGLSTDCLWKSFLLHSSVCLLQLK